MNGDTERRDAQWLGQEKVNYEAETENPRLWDSDTASAPEKWCQLLPVGESLFGFLKEWAGRGRKEGRNKGGRKDEKKEGGRRRTVLAVKQQQTLLSLSPSFQYLTQTPWRSDDGLRDTACRGANLRSFSSCVTQSLWRNICKHHFPHDRMGN